MNAPSITGQILLGVLLQAGILAGLILLRQRQRHPHAHLPPLARVRALPWYDQDAIALALVFIVTQLIALYAIPPLVALFPLPPVDVPYVAIFFQVMIFPLSALAAIVIIARQRGVSAAAWLGLTCWRDAASALGAGLMYYLAAFPFIVAAAGISAYVLNELNYVITPQPLVELLTDPATPLTLRLQILTIAVTLVPAAEEGIFRGIFLPVALRRASPVVAIGCVAFIFAAMHRHIPTFAPLFVLACAFSVAYLRTGRLAVPIVMHALFNGMNIAIFYLFKDTAPFI